MEHINPDQILVNNVPKFRTILDEGEVGNLVISIRGVAPGTYTGSLVVHNERDNTIQSVSINLRVLPAWPYYILFFAIGYAASWAFGSWNRSNALRERFQHVQTLARRVEKKYNIFSTYLRDHYSYLLYQEIYYKDLEDELTKYQINQAEKTADDLSAALTQLIVRENFDSDRLEQNASALGLSPDSFIRRLTTVSASTRLGGGFGKTVKNIQSMTYSYRRYLRNRPNTFVFNVGAIFLGLMIALSTLIQQRHTEIFYAFDWNNILLLLALGAGADSVKQIVERVFYKET